VTIDKDDSKADEIYTDQVEEQSDSDPTFEQSIYLIIQSDLNDLVQGIKLSKTQAKVLAPN
jgi:hypothetical protein